MRDSSDFIGCDPTKMQAKLKQIEERRRSYQEARRDKHGKATKGPLIVWMTQREAIIACVHTKELAGELLLDAFMGELEKALKHSDNKNLVLDLTGVEYVSGAVLPELVDFQGWLHNHDGTLVLCGLRPRVKNLVRLVGLDAAFPIEKTLDGAVAYIERSTADKR